MSEKPSVMQTSCVNQQLCWFFWSTVEPTNQYFYSNFWKYFLHLLEFSLSFLGALFGIFAGSFSVFLLLNFSVTEGANPFLDGFSLLFSFTPLMISFQTVTYDSQSVYLLVIPKFISLAWFSHKSQRLECPSASMVLPFGCLIGIFLDSVAPKSDFEKGF